MPSLSYIPEGLAAVAAIATLFMIRFYSVRLEKLTTRTNAHLEKMADIAERQAAFAAVQDGKANLSRLSAVHSAVQEARLCRQVSSFNNPQPGIIGMLDHVAWILSQVESSLNLSPDQMKDLGKLRRDCASVVETVRRREGGGATTNADFAPWNDMGEVLQRLPPSAFDDQIAACHTQISEGSARLDQPHPRN